MVGAACLVTGGAGVIGSHLAEALVHAGARVDVLDDLSSGRLENLPEGIEHFWRADIADSSALGEAIGGRRYRFVFHLAAHYANALSIAEPDRDLSVNLLGTLYLLQCLDLEALACFVFASSSCAYGYSGRANALSPEDLDTPYAIGKFSSEALIHFWKRHYALRCVILRYFNVYGPRSWPGTARSVIPNFFALAMAGRPLPITGSGEEIRDFTYVGDVAGATLRAAQSESALGGTYNIGTGRGTSIRSLALQINRLTRNNAGAAFLPARAWDRCGTRIARTGAGEAVDLAAPTTLEEGLGRTYDWIRTRSDFALP